MCSIPWPLAASVRFENIVNRGEPFPSLTFPLTIYFNGIYVPSMSTDCIKREVMNATFSLLFL